MKMTDRLGRASASGSFYGGLISVVLLVMSSLLFGGVGASPLAETLLVAFLEISTHVFGIKPPRTLLTSAVTCGLMIYLVVFTYRVFNPHEPCRLPAHVEAMRGSGHLSLLSLAVFSIVYSKWA